MKKQIKDLTFNERAAICDKHVYDNCDGCPFCLSILRTDKSYCVHHIMNVLEREVEVEK